MRFTRDVLGDPERADEIAGEGLEGYAARRKILVVNPERRERAMAKKSIADYRAEIADLKDEIADLQEENESLEEQLSEIADIVEGVEDEDEDDAEEEDGR